MVPIRFIVETFGFELDWDSMRRWVMLTTKSID
ncbi:copper amine oxidase N-terminal domain-containing protein [Paenibacillus sp. SCIV0701]|uniref:Copper amine oxidase N-terminal domain-containing protein n=1 Tax=Paenibacillus soyae TaxID=2969249 RepID=A0A9X2MSV1_9BACL|nr:copper amine oxidase N-terminal domain-containing protein [Paenibacillus soyae]MCR2805815.1 copper amine oxidase N-terminal domain-containing protein [Paenibacillus soyae]